MKYALILIALLLPACQSTGSATFHQAPLANAVLIEYISPDPDAYEAIKAQHERLLALYDDAEEANKAGVLSEWVIKNWWRVRIAASDWNSIELETARYSHENRKPIPQSLHIFRQTVRREFGMMQKQHELGSYQQAGLIAIQMLARIVVAKNGMPFS